jgi:signal transduction histidine kinase
MAHSSEPVAMPRRLHRQEAQADPMGSARALADSLQALVAGRRAQRPMALELHADVPEGLEIPRTLEAAGYCICEAALDNALRHSHARRVTVEILVRPGRLIVRVADDGVGFEPAAHEPRSGGLRHMDEYARRGGGRLELRSAPGAGTCVSALFVLSGPAG